MKQILSILCAALALPCAAQPVITSNFNPLPGDRIIFHYVSNVSPGGAGANVLWDFSSVSTNFVKTSSYKAVGACDSPNSYCVQQGIDTNAAYNPESYYRCSQQRFSFYRYRRSEQELYYDQQDLLRFPMTYTDSFADSAKGGGIQGQADYDIRQEANVTADAFGILVLPTGTFFDVLRIKTVTKGSRFDASNNYDFDYTEYMWVSPQYRGPLMVMANGTAYYAEHGTTSIGNTQNTISGISLYPNPTTDVLNITIPQQSPDVRITITDITGRRLPAEPTPTPSGYTLSTAQLSPGMYLLQVNTAEGRQVLKFEKH